MKLLTATGPIAFLLASGLGQANPAGTAEGAGVPQTAPMQDSQTINITRSGSAPSRKEPAENFTGSVRVDPLFEAIAPADTFGANVTFEPGARSAWHTHPLGQILIVTAGVGRVQRWGAADRGDPTRRCRSDSARSETLARSLAKHRDDAYRDRGTARRQEYRLDGTGQRRAVQCARVVILTT